MQKQKKPTVLGRISILGGTALVIAVAVGAVTLGSNALAERVANAPTPDPAVLTPVAVSAIEMEDHYTTTRRFLGQVEPAADAVLSFELGGLVTELAVEEGQAIAQGDVIARLDTALLEAEQARLEASKEATSAQLTFAGSRLQRAERLQGEGFSSQETLDQARATHDELTSRIAEIDAALSTVAINIEKSVLYAPFDGRIGALNLEVAETVNPGQNVLTLIENSEPLVRVGVPLNLTTDDLGQASIAVAGQVYAAKLQQLRPDIDPTTRTRTALFALKTDVALAYGQTANLLIDTDVAARGAWVSLDALQQGSGSIWSVLVVEDDVVRIAAVTVLHQQSDRAFVKGSFAEGAMLIRSGAHRVVPGQQVQVLQGGV